MLPGGSCDGLGFFVSRGASHWARANLVFNRSARGVGR
jgi:hypothetical protein